MKFTLALCLVVLFVVFEPIYGVRKICPPVEENCKKNVPACGRYGSTPFCKKFKNKCELELESCTGTDVFPVSAELCIGIELNILGICVDLNNNNGGDIGYPGYKPGFKPGYNPGGNGNGVQPESAVKPIVINAGGK